MLEVKTLLENDNKILNDKLINNKCSIEKLQNYINELNDNLKSKEQYIDELLTKQKNKKKVIENLNNENNDLRNNLLE